MSTLKTASADTQDTVLVISPNNSISLTPDLFIQAGVKTPIPRALLDAAKAEGANEVKE